MVIKKLLFSIVLFVGFFCGLQAQKKKEFKPEWNIGVGVGSTFSTMSIVPTDMTQKVESKNISQLQGGLSIRYITEKYLGFIAEINYSQYGWEQKFEEGVDYKYTHKLSYITIPFMTHIYFGSDRFRGFVNLGPQIGFLVNEKKEINGSLQKWIDSDPDPLENVTQHYMLKAKNKLDYGLTGGAGVELRTGIGNFNLEGRYYFGLGDIYRSRKSDPFQRSANRAISARLTYYIKAF